MSTPVSTTYIALKTAVSDEVLVNRDGSTGVQSTSDLALQLASSWPLQISGNAGKLFTTYVALAVTAHGEFTPWVYADPDVSRNGMYRWNGAGWEWSLPLPYSFLIASNVGAGTPAAIKATTLSPVSTAALILVPIAVDYAGEAATISFNGGAALAIKSSVGEDVTRLVAGSFVYGVISDTTFRLANDEAIASLIFSARDEATDAAERSDMDANRSRDEANRSEAARDIAAGYASDAVSQGDVPIYATVSGMPALEIPVGIRAIRVNGGNAIGDQHGGYFIDIPNGMPQAFLSGGSSSRAWYPSAEDIFVLRADWLGISDVSAILAAAAGIFKHVNIPTGAYRIADSLTIPKGVTVEFTRGAILDIQMGAIITWNGGIKADAYQQIFSGAVVQSAYTRIGDTPYVFALQGSPQIEWASPCWFGAVGDGITDDQNAIHCAIYFGNRAYLPELTFGTGRGILLRKSNMSVSGPGTLKALAADLGQIIGFRGDPPITSSGEPQRYVEDGELSGVTLDGSDFSNVNGFGANWAKGCGERGVHYKNIGRKAVTFQYWCSGCYAYSASIRDSATEAGSTFAAISIEGQTAGLNYSLDGGISSAADMLGTDMVGNIVKVPWIQESAYNYLVIQRAIGSIIEVGALGDCFGGGRHIVLGAYARKNRVTVQDAGDTERSFVACLANSEDNEVFIRGGDALGTGTDGYSVLDQGTRNRISGSCDHSNINTTNTRAIELAGAGGELSFVIKSCDSATAIGGPGTDYTIAASTKVLANGKRSVLAGGSGWKISGRFEPGTAVGVQINAANCTVQGATIGGDGPNRVLVSSGVSKATVECNLLTGANPTVDWGNTADLWASGIKTNNGGDVSSYHCIRMGTRIDGAIAGTPVGNVVAAIGSTMRDTTNGKHYTKASGSDATGWVVTGTQT